VQPELLGRVTSLLSSFIKGVRSRQQVLEYAVKPIVVGGLQLSGVEAQSLVRQAEEYFHLRSSAPVRRSGMSVVSKEPLPNSSPSKSVQPLQAARVQQVNDMTGTRPSMSDIVSPPVPTVQELIAPTQADTVLYTAVPPTVSTESVGPVEEIQTFTKNDFRRLNSDPAQAAQTLLAQMQNVSSESPVLGLAVRRAWFLSPLYSEYLRMLESSLQNGFLLEDMAQDTDALTRAEVDALLTVNRACEEV
jgi:hypothetical protein